MDTAEAGSRADLESCTNAPATTTDTTVVLGALDATTNMVMTPTLTLSPTLATTTCLPRHGGGEPGQRAVDGHEA